jgi:hypothetical protein
MGRLDGKIALITGGNSGIGLASAKAFAAEGARVVITGRDRVAIDAALRDVGGGTVGITANVGRMADLDNLCAEISKTFDRLDVVFANAGIAKVATFHVSTEEAPRQRVQPQRQGVVVHRAKGASAAEGRCFDHPDLVGGQLSRLARTRHLQCDQGCRSIVRAQLDRRPEAASDLREQFEPGTDGNTEGRQDERGCARRPGCICQGALARGHPAWTAGIAGGDGAGGGLPRIGRELRRDRQRSVRRRRRRANLTPVTAPIFSCHDQQVLIRALGKLQ